jgi:hypothetical protein
MELKNLFEIYINIVNEVLIYNYKKTNKNEYQKKITNTSSFAHDFNFEFFTTLGK